MKDPSTHTLLLVGPRMGRTPTGVSQAFEDFISFVSESADVDAKIVDLSLESSIHRTGRFRPAKALHVLKCIGRVFLHLPRVDSVYLVISSSTLGFLKDCLVIWMSFFFRRPITLHLNGGGYETFFKCRGRLLKMLIQVTLNRAASVVVLGNLLRKQFCFVRDEKIRVVPNGVDMIPSEGVRKAAPVDGEAWEFLYLSNLMVTKGYLEVAEAFLSLLMSGHLDVKVHFCGNFLHSSIEGALTDSNQAKARFEEILRMPMAKNRIIYHGNADSELKQRMLSRCHALVLPTNYPGEGQPLCILEAMAFGLPVLATAHAGVPEQVLDGTTGYLLGERSAGAVCKAVKKLTNPFETDFPTMSRASHSRYLSDFTVHQYRSRLASVLRLPVRDLTATERKVA